jgi:spermidine/putrescine transport system substrate-binding protein
MKKMIALVLCMVLTLGCFAGVASAKGDKVTLYVYNWGQYIAEGDDDSIDVIAAFEEAYPNIKVKYSTYDSNESMYAKLSGGGITVDVIIPSDYMVGRMRQEGMLQELNYDNIPNAQYIDPSFRGMAYDPEDKYSVPYTWGTVGIIYNTKYVDEADVTGWELLWNEKYADKILSALPSICWATM